MLCVVSEQRRYSRKIFYVKTFAVSKNLQKPRKFFPSNDLMYMVRNINDTRKIIYISSNIYMHLGQVILYKLLVFTYQYYKLIYFKTNLQVCDVILLGVTSKHIKYVPIIHHR